MTPPTRAGQFPSRRRSTIRRLILGFVLLLVLLSGWKVWNVYSAASLVRQDVRDLETLLASGAALDQVPEVSALVTQTRYHMQALRDEAALFFPVLPLFHVVPEYGPTLASAEALLDTGVGLTITVDETFTALAPALERYRADPRIASAPLAQDFGDAGPAIERAQHALDQAYDAWNDVPQDALIPSLQQPLEHIEVLLPVLELTLGYAEAAHHVATVAEPILADDGPELGAGLSMHLAEHHLQFEQAQQALSHTEQALESLDLAQVPLSFQPYVTQATTLLPEAQNALDLALIIPDMIGAEAPRTYLLLLQNPDELRPTGGFITGVGTVTFEDGRLAAYEIGDSGLYDDFSYPGSYPEPPDPLRRYMSLGLWALRDANWSPDFPNAAYDAESIYRLTQTHPLDGVVALTPTTLEYILAVLGPLSVADTGEPVTSENVVAYLHNAWSPQQAIHQEWAERKTRYLSNLATALDQRVHDGIESALLPDLVVALQRALNERHLLMVSFHRQEARLLAQRGWDGAIDQGSGDFLMIADANVGYNKANARIEQQIAYTVNLRNPDKAFGLLSITYTHRYPGSEPCNVIDAFTEGDYDIMTIGCYWNYVRVLVPAGTQLLSENTPPLPAEVIYTGQAEDGAVQTTTEAAGVIAFGGLILVPSGGTHTTRLYYQLPASVVQTDATGLHYHLRLQKQAGREPVSTRVRVTLPAGMAVVNSSHPLEKHAGNTYAVSLMLDQDQEISLTAQTSN